MLLGVATFVHHAPLLPSGEPEDISAVRLRRSPLCRGRGVRRARFAPDPFDDISNHAPAESDP
jgi:hypothetical protein